jgi:CO/xanthine dehydrogenase Mo-binding subunit
VKERVFGKRMPRTSDERLLRGRGMYVDDVPVRGALEVVFVRSPHAHARITEIDLEEARATPGVHAVYGAGDLGAFDRPLPLLFPHPDLVEPRTQNPIASDEVHYAGQIVAMIVAEDRYVAEDARERVRLELDPLPVVVDVDAALEDGADQVHSDMEGNVSGHIVQQVGDPDAAFRDAHLVLRHRYILERSAAMPMETRGMVAEWDPRGEELMLWNATQVVHPLRSGLAQFFDIPESRIRITAPDTGGGFGVKGFFMYPEEVLVPWAARELRRPVKWIEDRVEHFTASHHERTQIHDVEIAVTEDGVVTALRDEFLVDTGAFVPYGLELGRITAGQIGGAYRIPNIHVGFRGVYTNTVVCTPYRGAGRPHMCFVTERALDDVARALGIDQFEVRRRNFVGDDEFPYRRDGLVTADGFTVIMDSGAYFTQMSMLEEALDMPALREAQAASRETTKLLGVGLACYVESTGGGPYEGAHVIVEPDTGTVRVTTGFTDQGQSHSTTLAQVAAERLGADLASVQVELGDTAKFRWGIGTYASRGAVHGASAVDRAAGTVRDKALRLAANMLEVSPADLEVEDGRISVKGSPGTSVTLGQVAKAAKPDRYGFDNDLAALAALGPAVPRESSDEGPLLHSDEEPGLEATGFFSPQNSTWASGVHAAVIELDTETGAVRFVRYVVVHDCGIVINPLVVDGQVIGGIAQGVGGSFYERLAYDAQGQIQNASLMDFLIPYATEVPEVELHHLETPSPLNPLGVKGAGEGGAIPVPAVAAAAIDDALSAFGVAVRRMPLDPEELMDLAAASGAHSDKGDR